MDKSFLEFFLKNSILIVLLVTIAAIPETRRFFVNQISFLINYQYPEPYQLWIAALFPAVGYYIATSGYFFHWIGLLGSTSIFPFWVSQAFIPILIGFLINLSKPVADTVKKAFLFSIPVLFLHIDSIARQWFVAIYDDSKLIESPNTKIIYYFVNLGGKIGLVLLIGMVLLSWISANMVKQQLRKNA